MLQPAWSRTTWRIESSLGFAAGELVGGLFYHNYPGGTGLTNGSVFGKIAGETAGAYVQLDSDR